MPRLLYYWCLLNGLNSFKYVYIVAMVMLVSKLLSWQPETK